MPIREQKQHGPNQTGHGPRLSFKVERLRRLTNEEIAQVHGGQEERLSPSNWRCTFTLF